MVTDRGRVDGAELIAGAMRKVKRRGGSLAWVAYRFQQARIERDFLEQQKKGRRPGRRPKTERGVADKRRRVADVNRLFKRLDRRAAKRAAKRAVGRDKRAAAKARSLKASQRAGAQAGKRAGAQAGKRAGAQAAERDKRARKVVRYGKAGIDVDGTPISFRREPPMMQILLANMESGRVYNFRDVAAWLPARWIKQRGATESDPLAGKWYGNGEKPARLFWVVYDMHLAGLVGYRRGHCDDWTLRQFWLTSEGERYAAVCRVNWRWRFPSARRVAVYVEEHGPFWAFETWFKRGKRHCKSVVYTCDWVVRGPDPNMAKVKPPGC